MPHRAGGFCVYDDPALAIARARRDGLRVMYIDLDVHHGDGVQAIHWADPGVLTVSIHESGHSLFPGTGFPDELGGPGAEGSKVNIALDPGTGEVGWVEALELTLPALAAAFRPEVIVSQHGADSHAWDPLAHLNMTTTAMGGAARLVDAIAHRYAGGRWLATGGGGYDVYRVVPRSWSLVWLAGAHREVPASTPEAWRERWASEGARYGQEPPPEAFTDPPNAGEPVDAAQHAADARSTTVAALVRRVAVPRLVREARDRGWWDPFERGPAAAPAREPAPASGVLPILPAVDAATWSRLRLAARVVAPADPADGHASIAAGLQADALRISVAVDGDIIVGTAVSRVERGDARSELLALGVAPGWRRQGLAGRLLATHVGAAPAGVELSAEVTVAERDPIDPIDGAVRRDVARRLFEAAGFRIVPAESAVRAADPAVVSAVRSAPVSAGR
jgi:ribosomal protein S18 acetylase RimI-like enzyme